jgi:hypothetical protein
LQNRTNKVTGNSRELNVGYPESRWGIAGNFKCLKKVFQASKLDTDSHVQTMFGWTTRFHEAMIKK